MKIWEHKWIRKVLNKISATWKRKYLRPNDQDLEIRNKNRQKSVQIYERLEWTRKKRTNKNKNTHFCNGHQDKDNIMYTNYNMQYIIEFRDSLSLQTFNAFAPKNFIKAIYTHIFGSLTITIQMELLTAQT